MLGWLTSIADTVGNHLLEWHFLAFDAPLPLEFLFDSSVDTAMPWDRTEAR